MINSYFNIEFTYINCNICGKDDFHLLQKSQKYHFGKCDNCGFYYLNPMPKMTEKILKTFYYNYNHNKQFIKNFEKYKPLIKRSLKNKLNVAKISLGTTHNFMRSWKFLDIGCGGGSYVYAAKDLGLDSYGIDIDTNSCIFAKSQRLNVFNGNLNEAHYPNEYFDIIQIKQVLEHINDPKKFLLEVKRVLKNKGIIIIDVPNQNGLIPKIKILLKISNNEYGFLQPIRHLYAYTTRSLKILLQKTGFLVIKCLTSGPGDYIYYPLYGQFLLQKLFFKISTILNTGSVLVVYVTKMNT